MKNSAIRFKQLDPKNNNNYRLAPLPGPLIANRRRLKSTTVNHPTTVSFHYYDSKIKNLKNLIVYNTFEIQVQEKNTYWIWEHHFVLMLRRLGFERRRLLRRATGQMEGRSHRGAEITII